MSTVPQEITEGPPARGSTDELTSVVRRVAQILEAFRGSPALGVTDLVRLTGIPKSTVFRMTRDLTEVGILTRSGRTYRIGVKLFELGSWHYPALLRDALQPLLDDLQHVTGHTVQVANLHGSDVIYLEHYPARNGPRLGMALGSRVPANCCAAGKVLLAHARPERLAEILALPLLPRLTPLSITDPARLRTELDDVRRSGSARERDEFETGVSSVAVPVRDSRGRVAAALAVSGATGDFDPETATAAARLTAAVMRRAGMKVEVFLP